MPPGQAYGKSSKSDGSRQALALAKPRPDYAKESTKLKIKMLGSTYNATVVGESPLDA
ncbi:hypothetical protein [Rhizobium indigoferae]|uniref:Uncharacterized protein n=1 Tax=Rhizobium indigoferae TaxID=158891 RepID=A0ABZ0ZEL7_9HYPH|nr:hypothetical protein [Rhizobium indigoferae]NNU57952.1 hypothetical protein [Rhizobium indigoferae]WQN37292.1 hypothetical protein U5G49_002410 [Rhizobium indigoferae]GLR56593.1 hypothetical protein GCM10007919_13170 [Rhizobium indigoferae]